MASRQELLKTIDDQQKRIEKLSNKFRDVVSAYRGVCAEKDALSASLKALQNTQPSPSAKTDQQQEASDDDRPQATVEAYDDESAVSTLRHCLTTITEEKDRLEAKFSADRKQLLAQIEGARRQTKTERNEIQRQRTLLEQQLNEVRANLRQSQCERECEQSDHAAMIKELQTKLTQERMQSEHLIKQVGNAQKELKVVQSAPSELVFELTNQIEQLKNELSVREEQQKQVPHIYQLQKEMSQMKMQHLSALGQEQKRALQSQSQLAKVNNRSEERVSVLEAKISELSGTLGQYEIQRQQDQTVIDKLKSRISQLDQENVLLSQSHSQTAELNYSKLLETLKTTAEQQRTVAPTGLNFYDLLQLESPDADAVHSECKQRYEMMVDEFEKYKLKAQAVLKHKNKEGGSGESSADSDHLRSLVASLHTKLHESENKVTQTEEKYQLMVNDLRQSVAQLQTSLERQVSEVRSQSNIKLQEMEEQMHKQRQRTLQVLAEKEQELDTMRLILSTLRAQSVTVPADPATTADRRTRSSSSLDRSSTPPLALAQGEATNVYYSQELAKKDKEIGSLRKENRQFETAMRDIQHSSVTKELQHYEMNEKLKEEIRALESKLKLYREDANVEYLKNVLLQYMLCDSPTGKQHMLKAIAVLLKLSNKEIETIKSHNDKWFHFWAAK